MLLWGPYFLEINPSKLYAAMDIYGEENGCESQIGI